jgi:hypothetical protein
VELLGPAAIFVSLAFRRFATLPASVCTVLSHNPTRNIRLSIRHSTMKIAPKIKLSYFDIEGRAESMYVSESL